MRVVSGRGVELKFDLRGENHASITLRGDDGAGFGNRGECADISWRDQRDGDGSFGGGGTAGAGACGGYSHGDRAHDGDNGRRRILFPGFTAGNLQSHGDSDGISEQYGGQRGGDRRVDLHADGEVVDGAANDGGGGFGGGGNDRYNHADANHDADGYRSAGRAAERAGFYTTDHHFAGICRLCGRRIW